MSFFGLNIAKSGLFAAQKALNTVGHNIANANTPGYTRQRVELKADSPISYPGGKGMIGTGVDAYKITQVRNEFLDIKFRSEANAYGQWSYRNSSLSQIEAIMNEPSDSGIRKVMDNFFASFEELSKDPSSLTTRAVVRERAIEFSHTLNHSYSQLEKMVKDADFELQTTVNQINTYARDLAKLNLQIERAEMDGSNANDLRDQRNLLLDELSQLVDVEVKEVSNGEHGGIKTIISINGNPLVYHDKVDEIEIEKGFHKYKDELGLEFEVSHLKFKSGSPINTNYIKGKLKAELDMRDNINDSDGPKGIPYYMMKLNEFTEKITSEINRINMQGYGLDENSTGKLFFEAEKIADIDSNGDGNKDIDNYVKTYLSTNPTKTEEDAIQEWEADPNNKGYTIMKDGDGNWYKVSKTSAKDIKISQDIDKDLDNIAAAKTSVGNGKGQAGDNSNILEMSKLRHKDDMFSWGSADDFVKTLISNLGVDAQEAARMTQNQEVLINQVDSTRQSISGVSLDEEMSNMIKFQHAYNASARMITAVDEMIDVIVNRMGRVGL
ncbi:flagellar hook-associated protein FlgK [Tepidibacter formicigenes]|jgi:flagellar hook-associated protein 1 FlgK|uniref:Flagellar hook-associated protein 1 n=1 Tax=Tepidibacter formicigenes DSM 15518 TaxID=1123349 RepID=A0A1M6P102_9FIRM|nr:flagellar hook-associated protein FlgK [Tepidibacter formicigenes]SHK01580.1 flagellar hook-associated protein 1 FlgK [Tepidibacter formicigenes DSM 15518]